MIFKNFVNQCLAIWWKSDRSHRFSKLEHGTGRIGPSCLKQLVEIGSVFGLSIYMYTQKGTVRRTCEGDLQRISSPSKTYVRGRSAKNRLSRVRPRCEGDPAKNRFSLHGLLFFSTISLQLMDKLLWDMYISKLNKNPSVFTFIYLHTNTNTIKLHEFYSLENS